MLNKPTKSRFSEDEAARRLGVSVEQLRMLVRDHITAGDDTAVDSFQPSDLILLRVLAGQYKLVAQ
jgi:hypothetical protein